MRVDFHYLLSSEEFECLDFHDLTALGPEERQTVARALRKPLALLLDNVDYQHHQAPADTKLRQDLLDWLKENGIMAMFPGKEQRLQFIIDCSAESSEYYYPLPLWKHDTRLVMAIVTALYVLSDDDAVLNPDERKSLASFSFNHFQHLTENSQLCIAIGKALAMVVDHFGSQDPLVGSRCGQSFTGFFDSCAEEERLEHELPIHLSHGHHKRPHSSSQRCSAEEFPTHLRVSTGSALLYVAPIFKKGRTDEVPYMFWISTIPDMCYFINNVNDLLSFPKEVIAGETWNYMSMTTRTKRQAGRQSMFKSKHGTLWTYRDTLCETLSGLRQRSIALDEAFTSCVLFEGQKGQHDLKGESQKAAQLWNAFKHGFICWHLNCYRYGLQNLPFEKFTSSQKPTGERELEPSLGFLSALSSRFSRLILLLFLTIVLFSIGLLNFYWSPFHLADCGVLAVDGI
ncbi:uncharacterized protein N7483_004421 [Penicillium malachiteum]|uniref:uncharacterized protein n=1 Tax=Penicillium malachiteum TaxID=1324776 RepID=UPI002547FD2F|nr:uncharacterized protein N7483_004421 [Penicillium malachiteum]KAJ5729913.1 hypothetical protein N7483_004421 [Penicillium malachiteum]